MNLGDPPSFGKREGRNQTANSSAGTGIFKELKTLSRRKTPAMRRKRGCSCIAGNRSGSALFHARYVVWFIVEEWI
ncbi:hypothetical protein ACFQU1_13700 [Chelatococcus sp. GCM10030263]|uniref:hypothetical protein n=1 Tax=Chelatococcus sp. GCM10030263 TaxID=3273387 RepID=UPI00361792CD